MYEETENDPRYDEIQNQFNPDYISTTSAGDSHFTDRNSSTILSSFSNPPFHPDSISIGPVNSHGTVGIHSTTYLSLSNPPGPFGSFVSSSPTYPAASLEKHGSNSHGEIQYPYDDSKVRDAASALLSL